MLPSVISVTTPARDLTLLTMDELKSVTNVTDNGHTADLEALGASVADAIAQACNVATDGITPATLRQEALDETFRLNRWWNRRSHHTAEEILILSRRPIVSVQVVNEVGVLLDPASYEIQAGAGILTRLFNDGPSRWARGKVVVSYTAGWDKVPEGLRRAAKRLAKLYWSEVPRDPLLRQVNIPGVMERQYWIGAPTDPAIPQEVMDDLGPYINPQA